MGHSASLAALARGSVGRLGKCFQGSKHQTPVTKHQSPGSTSNFWRHQEPALDTGPDAVTCALRPGTHTTLYLDAVTHCAPKMNAELLVRVLRAYDASLDAAAVRAALAGPDSADLVRWAAVHLTPDTLLSVDELNQSVSSRSLSSAVVLMPNQICCPRGVGRGREAGHVVRPLRGSCPA
jgi:hypothetical protein